MRVGGSNTHLEMKVEASSYTVGVLSPEITDSCSERSSTMGRWPRPNCSIAETTSTGMNCRFVRDIEICNTCTISACFGDRAGEGYASPARLLPSLCCVIVLPCTGEVVAFFDRLNFFAFLVAAFELKLKVLICISSGFVADTGVFRFKGLFPTDANESNRGLARTTKSSSDVTTPWAKPEDISPFDTFQTISSSSLEVIREDRGVVVGGE